MAEKILKQYGFVDLAFGFEFGAGLFRGEAVILAVMLRHAVIPAVSAAFDQQTVFARLGDHGLFFQSNRLALLPGLVFQQIFHML